MESPDYEHFASIPWVAKHFQGDRAVVIPAWNRVQAPKPSPATRYADSFFGGTLNTKETLCRAIQVYTEPKTPGEQVVEIKTFFTLGNGLNGHPNICHGGMITAIFDECVGSVVPLNRRLKTIPNIGYFTAYLNVTFLKPIKTPTTILVRARTTKTEGRKLFAEGIIEDENGVALARADGLYVRMKSAL